MHVQSQPEGESEHEDCYVKAECAPHVRCEVSERFQVEKPYFSEEVHGEKLFRMRFLNFDIHNLVQYMSVQCSTVQYTPVLFSAVYVSTVQYSTVQYSAVQYSTL
jgi:hypothetical protein